MWAITPSPSYDHASSLGRNESDRKREARLRTQDQGYSVESYADKCQSYFYPDAGNMQRVKTFEAFSEAAKLDPEAAHVWLNMLESVPQERTLSLLKRIPQDRISPIAIEFSQRILAHNHDRLLNFRARL